MIIMSLPEQIPDVHGFICRLLLKHCEYTGTLNSLKNNNDDWRFDPHVCTSVLHKSTRPPQADSGWSAAI